MEAERLRLQESWSLDGLRRMMKAAKDNELSLVLEGWIFG